MSFATKFVGNVLGFQLGNDLAAVGGVEFAEKQRHVRATQPRRQENEENDQPDRDAADGGQADCAQAFEGV